MGLVHRVSFMDGSSIASAIVHTASERGSHFGTSLCSHSASVSPRTSTRWTALLLGNMHVSSARSWPFLSQKSLDLRILNSTRTVYATSTVLKNQYSGAIDTAGAIIIAVGKPLMAKLSDV